MEFELDLLRNSYDYLKESLEYYSKIGYDESHDPERENMNLKIKWKTTFLLLVQAIELLLKEKLSRISPILIYDNIDNISINNPKTISYKNSINRLKYLKPKLLKDEDAKFLIKCGDIRNDFVHYKVKLNSIDIKKKYCKLFELYVNLHSKFFNNKYKNYKYRGQILQILEFAKGFEIFRGQEYSKKGLNRVKADLKEGQEMSFMYNDNEFFERIRYGNEKYLLNKLGMNDFYYNKTYKYCGDCLATIGEYHMVECDWELCPKCGDQLITCDCFKGYCSIEYTKENSENKSLTLTNDFAINKE
ncbi:MAG: hypothetical protein IKR04_05775 [Clostridia bacterium]|nr:hypothetical protein [Clostridia bacterium]